MSEIDPEDRKRWYEKFEQTTEEVVRQHLILNRYHNSAENQAAYDWLGEKRDRRESLATWRFWMVLCAAVASVTVSFLGIVILF